MVLDLVYFCDLFEGLLLGVDGVILLYLDDGVVYMWVLYWDDIIGCDFSGSVNFQYIKSFFQYEEGSFFVCVNSDGVEWFYIFWCIFDLLLIVFVGYLQEVIFKSWCKMFYVVIFLLFIFMLLLVYLFLYVCYELCCCVSIEWWLEELVFIDGLIGLFNWCVLDDVLQVIWECCWCNFNFIFLVLFIDVDYFKFYNDSYGYKLGDEVLCEVVQVINENLLCNIDCVGCYGGEEFVVLLELIEEQGVFLMVQCLCDVVYSWLIVYVISFLCVVIISVGVVILQCGYYCCVEDVFNVVDVVLYWVKWDGRNVVRVSGVE